MPSDKTLIFSCLAYSVIFVFLTVGLAIAKVRLEKKKPPFRFKLLRGPGETLRRKLAASADGMLLKTFLASFVPFLISAGFLLLLAKIAPTTSLSVGLLTGGAIFLICFVPTISWSIRVLLRYRDDCLGYLGERAVGEELFKLDNSHYRVFHDLPAIGAKKSFNLDHVVVGPNGVFVLETKARRKGAALPDREEHVVVFDGVKLIWPWGEDRCGLEQAGYSAQWLNEEVKRLTGINLRARPIVVYPGWYVTEKEVGPVRVVNQKRVCRLIRESEGDALSKAQVDLIARQLEAKCRDVED